MGYPLPSAVSLRTPPSGRWQADYSLERTRKCRFGVVADLERDVGYDAT